MRIKRIQKRRRNNMILKLNSPGKILVFFVFLVFAFTGCDKSSEKEQVKTESDKVSKKISMPVKTQIPDKKSEAKKSEKDVNPESDSDIGKTQNAESLNQEQKPSDEQASEVGIKAADSDGEKKKDSEEVSTPFIKQLLSQESVDKSEKETSVSDALYNPKGRVDPFNPLVKESAEPKQAARKTEKEKRTRPKTPLEKLDLSQLKLVAVLATPDGYSAVLEESSGKGYVVEKGTYVGLNSGQIEKIESDRIIIKEIIEDISGKSVTREKVLQIQKPVGE
jgi:type IV pilus assembly protein PilP